MLEVIGPTSPELLAYLLALFCFGMLALCALLSFLGLGRLRMARSFAELASLAVGPPESILDYFACLLAVICFTLRGLLSWLDLLCIAWL